MKLIKTAIILSWFTVFYNIIEGVVSIYFGLSDDAIALAGFGADSFIEVGSAILVLWRLKTQTNNEKYISIERERNATKGIGYLFVALAFVTSIGSTLKLTSNIPPETTLPGFMISSFSLAIMFFLWRAKRKLAHDLDSITLMKDADCTLACIKLSVVLFLGSTIFLIFNEIWWADAVSAIILSYFIGKEGIETIINSKRKDFDGGCGCSSKKKC